MIWPEIYIELTADGPTEGESVGDWVGPVLGDAVGIFIVRNREEKMDENMIIRLS